MTALLTTDFPDLKLHSRGKVRDVYDLGDALLIVATDRISAFDVVMPNGIPGKGKLLTQLSLFWFEFLRGTAEHHLIAADPERYPSAARRYAEVLAGRSMLVRKAEVLPIECVVRGYLSGSAWKEYREAGTMHGMPLPAGLLESAKLSGPIFTPATKAQTGHDLNIGPDEAANLVGRETAERVATLSLAVYQEAADYALTRGIIIADTKFEFGWHDGRLILVDEVLTPDSSRFWPADQYQPGRGQPSFDKQYVRDYLETLDWNKQPPGPKLPADVVRKTSEKYFDAYQRLTGRIL